MESFIAQIMMFGGNFAPRGWAFCDGQLLAIAQYQALFSLLGTTYGGDGRTTFGLPELRGRVAMHPGAGPGLAPRSLGQRGGAETVTLTEQQLPSHSHTMSVNNGAGDAHSPANKVLASEAKGNNDYGDLPGPAVDTLDPACITHTGGGQSHDNMQPYLCVNYIIALEGIYPSRS